MVLDTCMRPTTIKHYYLYAAKHVVLGYLVYILVSISLTCGWVLSQWSNGLWYTKCCGHHGALLLTYINNASIESWIKIRIHINLLDMVIDRRFGQTPLTLEHGWVLAMVVVSYPLINYPVDEELTSSWWNLGHKTQQKLYVYRI